MSTCMPTSNMYGYRCNVRNGYTGYARVCFESLLIVLTRKKDIIA